MLIYYIEQQQQQPGKSTSEMDRKRNEAKRSQAERQDPESDPDADPNPRDGKGTRSPRYSTKSSKLNTNLFDSVQ